MRYALAAALLALAACAEPAAPPATPAAITPVETEAPSGAYAIDPSHTQVLFSADHLGFARYTTNFTDMRAELTLDTADPTRSRLDAAIGVRSLQLDHAPDGFMDIMMGEHFFDAARYPEMTFRSTSIELTGPNTARVIGDFTLRGVTRPLTLDVTFNGGYAGHDLERNARIGFSARGALSRSAFGMDFGLPPEGSNMGVADEVEIVIEAEFTGPAWTPPTQTP